MIELGLARVGRLLQDRPQPWKAVHVAGTNGKGSICAYISTILGASGFRCGLFTSPYVLDPWDSITINNRPVPKKLFKKAERQVQLRNRRHLIGATAFEILTATAFELFNKAKVQIGVVEVGMGGSLDATNILKNKAVTVISKIGLDHQAFLGNNIEEIAVHKAGIMRPNVPCVIDYSNEPAVHRVAESCAREIGTNVILSSRFGMILKRPTTHNTFKANHQWENFMCAYTAARIVNRGLALPNNFLSLLKSGSLPGRLQKIHIKSAGRRPPALLDGAHNVQSAEALGSYVHVHYRGPGGNDTVTWVLGISKGKDLNGILGPLIKPGDTAVAVEFGSITGMPWVAPARSADILAAVTAVGGQTVRTFDCKMDVAEAIRLAAELSGHGPLVIAGSLYLMSDVLRRRREEMRLDWLYMHKERNLPGAGQARIRRRQVRKIAEKHAEKRIMRRSA